MSRHMFKTLLFTIVTILLAGIVLAGCNLTKSTVKSTNDTTTKAPETTPAPPAPVTPSSSTQQSLKLTLYFPNADASGLVATERTVVVKDQEVIKTMFIELANPPSGLEKPLPPGTTLLDATVSTDGIATIDLSTDFQKNFGGGSAAEQMTMYSIVNTLTTLPNVHSVQFLLNGKKHDGILGHLDTSSPLKSNKSLISTK
ncbi:MAG: spore gernimation protein [Desulfosporosinus sp. BRH_c37]|nr:MAG: spore gernimation protein [Desulfosporosinus sp. BRH_c37]